MHVSFDPAPTTFHKTNKAVPIMIIAEYQGRAITQQVCTAFLSDIDRRDLETDGVKGPTRL